MKILYLTKGDHVDYQNDCLLIGLKELFGSDVVDYNKQLHNYVTYDKNKVRSLYGKGMTVSMVLPDLDVDRTDITNKIKNKFFDLIVYGSIWRCNDFFEKILEYYPKDKVVIVDGEDETNIHDLYNRGTHYFKRELLENRPRLYPISFSFPTSKVNFKKDKNKDKAFITPLDRKTYIYNDEESYYNDYRESRFGITLKKAGWDCLRHYEILGNGCIPLFINIGNCPENTMHDFPKQLCIDVLDDVKRLTPANLYDKFIFKFEEHFFKNNTTEAVAKYFINKIKN